LCSIFSAIWNESAIFCVAKKIAFREAGTSCMVIPQPPPEQLQQLFERFEAETFGVRAGDRVNTDDMALTGELSRHGLDAYQAAYQRYSFLRGVRI